MTERHVCEDLSGRARAPDADWTSQPCRVRGSPRVARCALFSGSPKVQTMFTREPVCLPEEGFRAALLGSTHAFATRIRYSSRTCDCDAHTLGRMALCVFCHRSSVPKFPEEFIESGTIHAVSSDLPWVC